MYIYLMRWLFTQYAYETCDWDVKGKHILLFFCNQHHGKLAKNK